MFHVFPRSLFGKGNGSRRFSMFVLRSMLVQIVLAIAVAVPAVGANADASATPLEPLTVTATQIRQSAFDVPYSASVITAHDLRERQVARTLTDGLGETPGIMVQKTGYGQASPYMRGFTGFRTLMLVDGIRLNNAVFREGPNQYWATVDLFAVDRLEVVKGASSVIHRSNKGQVKNGEPLDVLRVGLRRAGPSPVVGCAQLGPTTGTSLLLLCSLGPSLTI